jgi:dUTP pyrophosphatase
MLAQIKFAKVRESAIIPSKRVEDAGLDIYSDFTEESIVLQPHETKMIPTGIASACGVEFFFQLFEKGGTGTKGIGQRSGVIDSGYRNEWFVPITNHNTKPLIITKETNKEVLDSRRASTDS